MNISERSLKLFLDLARDAGNWSGMPLFGGNVGRASSDKGNLTDLKIKGLVYTHDHEGDGRNIYVCFTDAGKRFAAEHGVVIE